MATQKAVKFLYQGLNKKTGLTDVKAHCYLNGLAKAVGANALTGVELDATNAKGDYEITIPAATLIAWGVLPGQLNALEVHVDSGLFSAPAIYHADLTVSNLDDIEIHLQTMEGAIASVKADTAAIKADLETGTNSLANIFAAINQIKSNAGFAVPVPATLLRPGTGSNPYRIPIRIYNEANSLVDPTNNTIIVQAFNQAGADRSNYLTGAVAGNPGSAPAVRDSLGSYHVDITIPSNAAQEEIRFVFSYSIDGQPTMRDAVTQIISDVQADGFALESTLQSVKTTAENTNTVVNNATYGNAAIRTQLDAVRTQTDKIGDATIGLAAIRGVADSIKSELIDRIEGTGFVSAQDSLHAISVAIAQIPISGGRAV